MKQRVPRRAWRAGGAVRHRPRVLIEDGNPALAISDFSMFERAGFDVAFCSGPQRDPSACPLLRGQRCPVVAGADAVLHGLDPKLGIAAAIRRQSPCTPVIVEQELGPDGRMPPVPEGCLPLVSSCSVRGQIDALWQAVTQPTRPR